MQDTVKEYLEPGKKNLILIYVLFLLGSFLPLFPIIGAVLAYANTNNTNLMLRSHYVFAFRTFWLSIIGFCISFITAFIFIGILLYMIVFVWVVVRSIIALQYVLSDSTHPDPLTFWIK
ncbi:MAG: hypothetical protein P8P83_01675 [Rickettsiaceae bacterium]|nr:hypothetical protein [Rickettsiaceae bacterium]